MKEIKVRKRYDAAGFFTSRRRGSTSNGAISNALASNFLDSGREAVSQILGERASGETLKWRRVYETRIGVPGQPSRRPRRVSFKGRFGEHVGSVMTPIAGASLPLSGSGIIRRPAVEDIVVREGGGMDRVEALRFLRGGPEGVAKWNRRRLADEVIPSLAGADLRKAILRGADLRKADLRKAILRGADLREADLREADLDGVKLSEAILRVAKLSVAILRGADLRGADLRGADLVRAYLAGARLDGARLFWTRLDGARLYGANLHGARLAEAYLAGADLREARHLTQEQLESARGDSETKLPEGLGRPKSWRLGRPKPKCSIRERATLVQASFSIRERVTLVQAWLFRVGVRAWAALVALLLVALVAVGFPILAWKRYYTFPPWTGFGAHELSKNQQLAKTLWDWMQLFLIPAGIAIGVAWLNQRREKLARETEDRRRQEERERADRRSGGEALQKYFDSMTELIRKAKLKTSGEGDVRAIAQARTLTVLRELDGPRKGTLLRFLYESKLIVKDSLIVGLNGTDLSKAEFFKARLCGARLAEADLRRADFHEACLCDADLHDADLRDADLGLAHLSKADLHDANLDGAYLVGTDLDGAILDGANLDGVNLRGARHLTQDQLASARGDSETELPEELNRPESWTRPSGGEARGHSWPTSAGPDSAGPTSSEPTSPGPDSPGPTSAGQGI